MHYNWPIIGDKIFGILRGRGYRVQMFDKGGMKTMDPHEATRYLATIPSSDPELESYDILLSLHDKDASSHMDIKTPDLKNDEDFDRLIGLKDSLQVNVGDSEGLSVNWYKFDHDIDIRSDAVNNIKESRDIGKPFGTTKSSYQVIGDSKLIIRHTDPVNEEKQGSRWRHIKNIFIETRLGERFVYPHAHIAGARAMARHLSNEGTMSDEIGIAITEMSGDYVNLKRAARMLRQPLPEMAGVVRMAIKKVNKDSKRLAGNRGYEKGIELIREGDTKLDEAQVGRISETLHSACGCQSSDEPESHALNTAARYVALMAPVQNVDEATKRPLYRSRDIDVYWNTGDGYWIGSTLHDDGDVKKVDLDLYHLEDDKGLDDQFAHAWRHVGFINVSPYSPSEDDILDKVDELKAKDRGGDGETKEGAAAIVSEDLAHPELRGILRLAGI